MRCNRLGKEMFGRGAATTSSTGLFPLKMGGAAKGPDIGWSLVWRKYSWECCFCNALFFPPIPFSKGQAQQTRLELRSRAENGMLLTAGDAARIGALQPKL